ncbi:uncharacterized protein BKCO1_13000157 [Diplodia corticola]|uniref:Uncharacterized protein n=1 Tax=Diplodia corticola TaxID=236234 RepID=A0A1J9R648_9PEZI|nr:uncharacterized protein BKCO1_13000157 [Diplodia corticola]OJD36080.1 hypothetical protein BKCO1_13000157 [Diplodia corticola]
MGESSSRRNVRFEGLSPEPDSPSNIAEFPPSGQPYAQDDMEDDTEDSMEDGMEDNMRDGVVDSSLYFTEPEHVPPPSSQRNGYERQHMSNGGPYYTRGHAKHMPTNHAFARGNYLQDPNYPSRNGYRSSPERRPRERGRHVGQLGRSSQKEAARNYTTFEDFCSQALSAASQGKRPLNRQQLSQPEVIDLCSDDDQREAYNRTSTGSRLSAKSGRQHNHIQRQTNGLGYATDAEYQPRHDRDRPRSRKRPKNDLNLAVQTYRTDDEGLTTKRQRSPEIYYPSRPPTIPVKRQRRQQDEYDEPIPRPTYLPPATSHRQDRPEQRQNRKAPSSGNELGYSHRPATQPFMDEDSEEDARPLPDDEKDDDDDVASMAAKQKKHETAKKKKLRQTAANYSDAGPAARDHPAQNAASGAIIPKIKPSSRDDDDDEQQQNSYPASATAPADHPAAQGRPYVASGISLSQALREQARAKHMSSSQITDSDVETTTAAAAAAAPLITAEEGYGAKPVSASSSPFRTPKLKPVPMPKMRIAPVPRLLKLPPLRAGLPAVGEEKGGGGVVDISSAEESSSDDDDDDSDGEGDGGDGVGPRRLTGKKHGEAEGGNTATGSAMSFLSSPSPSPPPSSSFRLPPPATAAAAPPPPPSSSSAAPTPTLMPTARRERTSNAAMIKKLLKQQGKAKKKDPPSAAAAATSTSTTTNNNNSQKKKTRPSTETDDAKEEKAAWQQALAALDADTDPARRRQRRRQENGAAAVDGSQLGVGSGEQRRRGDREGGDGEGDDDGDDARSALSSSSSGGSGSSSEVEREDVMAAIEEERERERGKKEKELRRKRIAYHEARLRQEREKEMGADGGGEAGTKAGRKEKKVMKKKKGKSVAEKGREGKKKKKSKSEEFVEEEEDEDEVMDEVLGGVEQGLDAANDLLEDADGDGGQAAVEVNGELGDDFECLFNEPSDEGAGQPVTGQENDDKESHVEAGKSTTTASRDLTSQDPVDENLQKPANEGINQPSFGGPASLQSMLANATKEPAKERNDDTRKPTSGSAREAAQRNALRREQALANGPLKKHIQPVPSSKPKGASGAKSSAFIPTPKSKNQSASQAQRKPTSNFLPRESDLLPAKASKKMSSQTANVPRRPATALNDPDSVNFGPLVADKTPSTPLSVLEEEDDKQLHFWKEKGLKWEEIRILYAARTGKKFSVAGLQYRLKRVHNRWPDLTKDRADEGKKDAEKEKQEELQQQQEQPPPLGGKKWDPNAYEQYMANQQALADFLTDGEEESSSDADEINDNDDALHTTASRRHQRAALPKPTRNPPPTSTTTIPSPAPLAENEVWFEYHVTRQCWDPSREDQSAAPVYAVGGPGPAQALHTLREANAAAGEEIQRARFGVEGVSAGCKSFSCETDAEGMHHYRVEHDDAAGRATVRVDVGRSLRAPGAAAAAAAATRPRVGRQGWLGTRGWVACVEEVWRVERPAGCCCRRRRDAGGDGGGSGDEGGGDGGGDDDDDGDDDGDGTSGSNRDDDGNADADADAAAAAAAVAAATFPSHDDDDTTFDDLFKNIDDLFADPEDPVVVVEPSIQTHHHHQAESPAPPAPAPAPAPLQPQPPNQQQQQQTPTPDPDPHTQNNHHTHTHTHTHTPSPSLATEHTTTTTTTTTRRPRILGFFTVPDAANREAAAALLDAVCPRTNRRIDAVEARERMRKELEERVEALAALADQGEEGGEEGGEEEEGEGEEGGEEGGEGGGGGGGEGGVFECSVEVEEDYRRCEGEGDGGERGKVVEVRSWVEEVGVGGPRNA